MSTSSSTSSSSSAAPPPPCRLRTRSNSTTPSPSPFQTPLHHSLSSVPFSWEKSPGIPKIPSSKSLIYSYALPLPPPVRPKSFSTSKVSDSDPFAIALVECTKVPVSNRMDPWIISRPAKSSRRFGVPDGLAFRLGLMELYGSCKSSVDVEESTVEVRRVGAYRILNSRRIG